MFIIFTQQLVKPVCVREKSTQRGGGANIYYTQNIASSQLKQMHTPGFLVQGCFHCCYSAPLFKFLFCS